MRELLDEFRNDDVYVFRKEYTTFNHFIYESIDGMKVNIIDKNLGYINRGKVSIRVTPNMCERILK